jgi:hypothetical protein
MHARSGAHGLSCTVGLESGQCGSAGLGAHAAAEQDRVVTQVPERAGQTIKVT